MDEQDGEYYTSGSSPWESGSGSDEDESNASQSGSEDVPEQPDGDFDRLIGRIRSSEDTLSTSVLSKIWDTPLPEDEDEQFHEDLRAASGIGKVGKGKGKARGHRRVGPPLSHQVRALIGEGNTAYVDGNLQEAIRIMTEVIRIEPRAASAWALLATCYREMNEPMKALQLAIMGAHLKHDADEWYHLAQQSRQLGYHHQALYCYGKVTKLDTNNVDAMWDRATLARELGDLKTAKNAYLAILKRYPHDINVLTELRLILVELGDLKLCASLYQHAFEHFTSTFPAAGVTDPAQTVIDPSLAERTSTGLNGHFSLMEILVLADLYNSLGIHEKAIDSIRGGVRWLQGRGSQKFWDACPDDREYDVEGFVRDEGESERAGAVGFKQGFFELDVNARHRLAVARLKLGDLDEGKIHAKIVLSQDIVDYAPLFIEIADAYFEKEMYSEARPVYEMLGADAGTSSMYILQQAAACRRNLGDLKDAAEVYNHIIASDPSNTDAKMKLAEIYEITNQPRKALELVYQVIDARKKRAAGAQDGTSQEGQSAEAAMPSLFTEKRTSKGKGKAKQNLLDKSELVALEQKKTGEALQTYARVKQLWNGVLRREEVQENEWLIEAEKLVEMFRETRKLFLSRGALPFRGMLTTARRRKVNQEADEDNMASRLQLDLEHESKSRRSQPAENIEYSFRGIHFDDWLSLLMQYAFVMTRRDQFDDADEVLRHILVSHVYQDRASQDTLRLALITCALYEKKYAIVLEQCRKLMSAYQYNNEPFRILLASLAGGLLQTDQFISTTLQKFFIREIRNADAVVKGDKIAEKNADDDGESVIAGAELNNESTSTQQQSKEKSSAPKPTKHNPAIVTIHGQACNAGKSYQTALFYLLLAYDYFSEDPMICLTLAIASMGRAMQRQADNRNYLIVQGIAFLTRYRSLRAPLDDELEYNFGRAYHQLGLYSHAVRHYEAVLSIIEERQKVDKMDIGLAREAAYNLSLIYVSTGAPALAQLLYRRWLSL